MSDNTAIEWTDATINAVNGCSVTSPGCTSCYAMRLAGTRMKHHPSRAGLTQDSKAGPVWTDEVRPHEPALLQPLRWKRPRRIFWNAHGDLFHPAVPDEWIDRVFAVCALTPRHTHQILTKRPERMRQYLADPKRPQKLAQLLFDMNRRTQIRFRDLFAALGVCERDEDPEFVPLPLPNVWLGTSVEDQARADERIPHLLATPAAVRWLSCEPLLGPVSLETAWDGQSALESECWGDCAWCDSGYPPLHNCQKGRQSEDALDKGRSGLDWVVVGGESGPGARPMHSDWARSLRDQCAAAGVPFLFKQWGAWAPVCEMTEEAIDACYHPAPEHNPEATRRCKVDQCVLHADGQRFDGRAMFERPAFEHGSRAMTMMAIGKNAAGRLLDGMLHDGFPDAHQPEPAP